MNHQSPAAPLPKIMDMDAGQSQLRKGPDNMFDTEKASPHHDTTHNSFRYFHAECYAGSILKEQ